MTKTRKIEEAMSFGSFMDIEELRRLYYGRQDIFVCFTDDGQMRVDNYSAPSGFLVHRLNDVVGRKASTYLFYADVLRYRPSKPIVEISAYTEAMFSTDVSVLNTLSYLQSLNVEDFSHLDARTPFERLWETTRNIAQHLSESDYVGLVWRGILTDLGYIGFEDKRGRGVLSPDSDPCLIVFSFDDPVLLDIVPIQKYRKDERDSVIRAINMKLKYTWLERNRVAKYKTDRKRTIYGKQPDNV